MEFEGWRTGSPLPDVFGDSWGGVVVLEEAYDRVSLPVVPGDAYTHLFDRNTFGIEAVALGLFDPASSEKHQGPRSMDDSRAVLSWFAVCRRISSQLGVALLERFVLVVTAESLFCFCEGTSRCEYEQLFLDTYDSPNIWDVMSVEDRLAEDALEQRVGREIATFLRSLVGSHGVSVVC